MVTSRIFVIIAILSSIIAAVNFMPIAAADISQTGKDNAQRPGHGVCNTDEKIHEHTGIGSSADAGFHKGVGKNFGSPLGGCVVATTTCQNPLP
jgi:hypothetical protein